jgi:hypothetical protein
MCFDACVLCGCFNRSTKRLYECFRCLFDGAPHLRVDVSHLRQVLSEQDQIVNIDPVLAQFIITAIVAIPVYFKMRSEWRKATAEADSSNVKDALELKREYKADMAALEVKFDKLSEELQAERAARAADKIIYEAEIAKVRLELQTERAARIEAVKRISALEDELDRRAARIKELESSNAQQSGFGGKK